MAQISEGRRHVGFVRAAQPYPHTAAAAGTVVARESLGYPDVRNYVSAWGEWGNREDSVIVIPPAA